MVLAATSNAFSGQKQVIAADTVSTLDAVQRAGYVNCVLATHFQRFTANKAGECRGMDIDICRGVRRAVFGDASNKVKVCPVQWLKVLLR